ncbi:MAG TPA: hypothetical protein VN306_02245, partial [Mycobacterium sp.]|nr:hypothetical protein [Mycobacterium sp.]
GGLSVDLERILFVEQIQIEQFDRHMPTVIQTDTNILLVGDFAPPQLPPLQRQNGVIAPPRENRRDRALFLGFGISCPRRLGRFLTTTSGSGVRHI